MTKESEINTIVAKAWANHGAVIINDSFVIPGGNKLVSAKPSWLVDENPPIVEFPGYKFTPRIIDIDPPFQILKEKETFEFIVIKNNDTLTFELTDPDYEDPSDPTFRETFKNIFN